MPNWCENTVIIEGDNVQKVVDYLKTDKTIFDFNKVIPYPQEFIDQDILSQKYNEERNEIYKSNNPEEITKTQLSSLNSRYNIPLDGYMKDGYNSGGYGWCTQNWDTKWNLSDEVQLDLMENKAVYEFLSAWSPPINVIRVLSELFPHHNFMIDFNEPGMAFRGRSQWKNGEQIAFYQETYNDEEENENDEAFLLDSGE